MKNAYSNVKGFNYQASYGANGMINWLYFDADLISKELHLGKMYFPNINTIRIWLSYDAYILNKEKFCDNLEKVLCILDSLGLKAIICLLNRWHNTHQDQGGVYIEQIIGGLDSSMCPLIEDFVTDIVSRYAQDDRVLIWDMVNEPFYYHLEGIGKQFFEIELEWLKSLYRAIKKLNPKAPVSTSIVQNHSVKIYDYLDEISDVYLLHPYFVKRRFPTKEAFLTDVRSYVEYAQSKGKACLVTETCWGAERDEDHVVQIKDTLDVLTECNVGYTVHALMYSAVADLHSAEDGPVGGPSNLAFINKDGSLRAGHEIFNQY